jgi:succinate dehydrogenase / fumarate reductase cytochrome b subunit
MTATTIKKRPKYLNFTTLVANRLPVMGRVSFLHRISGVCLVFCLPALRWLFGASLGSPESFAAFRSVAASLPVKVILAGLIWAYAHHFCAGIRFLFLDFHIGVEKEAAYKSAVAVFVVSLALTVILICGILL